ncbi:hypothetical protein EZV62_006970 [Acer yangbiense]|uniref:Rx N-terminal domain-containing protein n=1 Tax=Acer yangbiense TaxID=1000413 RepID=A0A5C7I8Z0_9ROSI|nr:hypothetical protein EZV62_006970 [Acer yangbiense]
MVEIAISIAGKLSLELQEQLENLETEICKLNDRRSIVDNLVEESRRNGEEIEQQVNSWIDRATKINDEASQVIRENGEANMKCLNGWCLNPMKRHKHSWKAAKKVKDVVEVYGEGDI